MREHEVNSEREKIVLRSCRLGRFSAPETPFVPRQLDRKGFMISGTEGLIYVLIYKYS